MDRVLEELVEVQVDHSSAGKTLMLSYFHAHNVNDRDSVCQCSVHLVANVIPVLQITRNHTIGLVHPYFSVFSRVLWNCQLISGHQYTTPSQSGTNEQMGRRSQ